LTRGESARSCAPLVPETGVQVHLIVRSGSNGGQAIACRRVVTLIGSRSGCKVHIPHPQVASVHAAIVNTGSEILLVDLFTHTGTLLNGLKIEHEVVADGDLLTVGPFEFRIRLRQMEPHNNGDLHPFDLDFTPHAVALEHVPTGRVLQPNRRVCVMGRKEGCDIQADDNSVSRAHALLFQFYGHPAIFDLLSRNRTLVNDVAVGYQALKDNDIIGLGETRFKVRVVESKVVERARSQTPRVTSPISIVPQAPLPDDMIDIGSVEGSQRWAIAEKFEKASRAG